MISLVSSNYLATDVVRDVKFNVKPQCSICAEEFDSKVHIPKVLSCGHTFCVECIKRILSSVQVSFVGDGEAIKAFQCVICRCSMEIPNGEASKFATNYQLLESIAPQDTRLVKCITCAMTASETSFHICRECTIKSHDFDVQTIMTAEQVIHPDTYPICSTCILKNHNCPGHTILDYLPIRLDFQYKKNELGTKVICAQLTEKFADARRVLATMPLLVEKKEAEVSKMVDLMKRAKSSQTQELIFLKYKQEMGEIITVLDKLRKEGGALNTMVQDKVEILGKINEEVSALYCNPDAPNLREVLKISEIPETEVEPKVPDVPDVPESSPEPEVPDVQNMADPTEETIPFPTETSPSMPHSQFSLVRQLGASINSEEILQNVVSSVRYAIDWIYQKFLTNTVTNNNNNHDQDSSDVTEPQKLIIGITILTILTILFMFFLKLVF